LNLLKRAFAPASFLGLMTRAFARVIALSDAFWL
jgi:hypothetical protein